MAKVGNETGFSQLTKLNVTDTLFVNDKPISGGVSSTIEFSVNNNSGVDLNLGDPIETTSVAADGSLNVKVNALVSKDKYLGICAENIPNGSSGTVLYQGLVEGVNTTSFTPTDPVYLGDGAVTPTKATTNLRLGIALDSLSSGTILLVQPIYMS